MTSMNALLCGLVVFVLAAAGWAAEVPVSFVSYLNGRSSSSCSTGALKACRKKSLFRPGVGCLTMRKDSNNGEGPQGNKDDFEYRGGVDWDAEWKKVLEGQQDKIQRPKGTEVLTDFQKTQKKLQSNLSRIPSSLSDYVGDWRFWLVVILALSFIASFVTTFNRPQLTVQSTQLQALLGEFVEETEDMFASLWSTAEPADEMSTGGGLVRYASAAQAEDAPLPLHWMSLALLDSLKERT
mmetsp:Transcript_22676/g.64844  ORF Transcript_22676/g.64844 Transcript_22676/m.64844 type:complete len:239 (-) Transcript_22676:1986-2702(-)